MATIDIRSGENDSAQNAGVSGKPRCTSVLTPASDASGTMNSVPRTEPLLSRERVAPECGSRPEVRGKFIWCGSQRLYIRGVTYGTFKPDADGREYPPPDVVDSDFAKMSAIGLNAVRTYTQPPKWLLDLADRHGLHVMIGLALERYIGYLIDTRDAPDFWADTRALVRENYGHPAILCYSIANEIPASTVRWLGRKRVEHFLVQMYKVVKAEDPGALVTYVNYPSTEYLDLPFLDIACFNVYLEAQETLDAYLARLHSISGNKPLLMGEIGLDSIRNGEDRQAEVLDWQIRTAFGAECSGVFVYAWTDEWYRGGAEVHDWNFGLTRRDRKPKPALSAVREAFADAPFAHDRPWPRTSVVVCSYNGSQTIRETLDGLSRLEYPDFEIIVVDDGSTDATPDIAAEFDCRLIRTPNRGLSYARNLGVAAASGEIVAFVDDDAYPDSLWLRYLVARISSGAWVGAGGPNLPPPGDGAIAECIANAPGGPVHVLLSDREAEHIPGCNMAFRKSALESIGGFDEQFRIAGDDVDICWRLIDRGWKIGFSPAAVIWHHRRNSARAYWKQQRDYGSAEALLEQKWPEKYNELGNAAWIGRVYGKGRVPFLGLRSRIYHGMWGSAPFQYLYQDAPGNWQALSHTPEWYLLLLALAVISAAGALWAPLLLVLPLAAIAWSLALGQSIAAAARAEFPHPSLTKRALTAVFYLTQPLARVWGRMHFGVRPWRRLGPFGWTLPRTTSTAQWTDQWRSSDDRIREVEANLRDARAFLYRGGDYDRWDLEVRAGLFGAARLVLTVEEQGGGCQMVRFRLWPRFSRTAGVILLIFAALSSTAAFDGANAGAALLAAVAVALFLRMLAEAGSALSALLGAIRGPG